MISPEERIESDDSFDETDYNFLANKMVYIHVHGFDEDSHASLVHHCILGGATVITYNNYMQTVDYMIVPIDILSMDGITGTAHNTVNQHWLVSLRWFNVLCH